MSVHTWGKLLEMVAKARYLIAVCALLFDMHVFIMFFFFCFCWWRAYYNSNTTPAGRQTSKNCTHTFVRHHHICDANTCACASCAQHTLKHIYEVSEREREMFCSQPCFDGTSQTMNVMCSNSKYFVRLHWEHVPSLKCILTWARSRKCLIRWCCVNWHSI